MKTKSFLIAALLMGTTAGFAQQVEIDDMYFTSKDRALLNASKPLPTIKSNEDFDAVEAKATVNPTDSYSGRGTNPDYTAHTVVSSPTGKTNPSYFSSTYQPKTGLQNSAYPTTGLNNLYSYNNGYNNYGYNGFNNYGMNSFYGNGYSSFYSPFSHGYGMGMYPYYGGSYGLGSMLGFGYSSFGMGYPYSYYNGYSSFGSPYGYGYSSYYPSSIVVINNDGNSGYVHGKRGVRGGSDSYYDAGRGRSSMTGNNAAGSAGGRVASSNQYYDRSWRNSIPETSQTQTRSYYGNTNGYSSGNTRSSWDGNNGQSSFGNSRSSYNYGNSNSGFSGGSRSSGFSGGGFSGGGGGGSSSGGGGGGGGGGRGRH